MNLAINRVDDGENPNSSSSSIGQGARRQRRGSILLQTITTDNRTAQPIDDFRNDEDHPLLTSHYDDNRLKQERLLLYTNIFRLLVIVILAPIIYFLA